MDTNTHTNILHMRKITSKMNEQLHLCPTLNWWYDFATNTCSYFHSVTVRSSPNHWVDGIYMMFPLVTLPTDDKYLFKCAHSQNA